MINKTLTRINATFFSLRRLYIEMNQNKKNKKKNKTNGSFVIGL
jgi:hypothetical protein